MLNHISVIGRLVRGPDLRYTQSNVAVATFTIACDRNVKNKDQETVTDFIYCVAWRHNAEFVGKYFSKGKTIVVDGSLQQRKYTTKDGENRQVHVGHDSVKGEMRNAEQHDLHRCRHAVQLRWRSQLFRLLQRYYTQERERAYVPVIVSAW